MEIDRSLVLKRFGDRMRRIRKRQRMSQEHLAFEAELDRTYVSSVELGKRNLSLVNIVRIANALGIKPKDLV